MKPFLVFSNDEKCLNAGANKFQLATNHYWFDRPDGVYDCREVSQERMTKYVTSEIGDPFVIDIEKLKLLGTEPEPIVINDDNRKIIKAQLQKVVNHLRTVAPDNRIAWYRMVPRREYWLPILHRNNPTKYQQQYNDYRKENEQNIRHFAQMFDFLCPSLYDPHPERRLDDWETFADYNLRECIPARKQNYSYVSTTKAGTEEPIHPDRWQGQLEFLKHHEYCDGIFVYSFESPPDHDWQSILIETLLKD